MVLALLPILNVTSSMCVDKTDVCAPAGSTLEGAINWSGGQVTITPSKPMRALGGEFKAGAKVIVSVQPWGSSDKTSGAIVHVSGELAKEMEISGVRVAGTVRIGQMQGRKTTPMLVEASDIKGGHLKIGTIGTVDVSPGMRIAGSIDISGARIEITSAQPIHALGLDFAAGPVRIEQHQAGVTIGGTLAKPQTIGGVHAEKFVQATLGGKAPTFSYATLAKATPLKLLGLPDGEAPAGTEVRSMPAATQLVGPGPFTICGVALAPAPAMPPTQPSPTLTITPFGKEPLTINGVLAGADVDVGDGMRMTGAIALRFAAGTCKRVSIDGMLARSTVQRGLHFAAKTKLVSGEFVAGQPPYLRGTLEQPAVVDGLNLTGEVMVSVSSPTVLHMMEGTLAKEARFEEWELPRGSHVQRFGTGWTFKVPARGVARAKADHRGERVDGVIEAYSDDNATMLTLRGTHTPKGTKLAMRSVSIEHATSCVVGGIETAQQHGIFAIPKDGSVTLCGGKVRDAQGQYAVPSLKVGRYFATEAIAGDRATPPSSQGPFLDTGTVESSQPTPPPAPRKASSTSVTGYWIQINSLCQGPSGIPQPPPDQRWIWVDLKGEPANQADRKELDARAKKPGKPCPVTRCCPP
jgi:hypothetical protein